METSAVHDTSIKVPVYCDEFIVLLKAINRAIDSSDYSQDEIDKLISFKDDFATLALQYGV
jgi:hypothetical protein